jgi:hypothetical protein
MRMCPALALMTHYSSGLYAWLTAREELAATVPGFRLLNADGPGYGGDTGTPLRLVTLRVGGALDLPVSDLPRHARIGLDNNWWSRCTVEPDSTIVPTVDTGEWAIEDRR